MSAVLTAINHSPEWEPPDDDELAEFPVEKKFQQKLYECFDGLTRITVNGVWRDPNDAKLSQKVCVMEIKNSGTNKVPGISKDLLARALVARGTEHAEHVNAIVTYKVLFYGNSDAHKGRFQIQSSFTIDGRAEDDDDDIDDEEEEEVASTVTRPQNHRVSTQPADSEPRTLAVALGPARIRARSPQDVVLDMMRIQQEMSRDQNSQVFAELRASMAQQRMDYSDAFRTMQESHSAVLGDIRSYFDEQRKDIQHSREEVNKSNARVVQMSEQMTANVQGQQEATRKGWEAFQNGMQMKFEALGQSMSWERQFMLMQMEAVTREQQQQQEDEGPGWLKDYGPFIFAGLGQVLSNLGHPLGEKIQELAADAMSGEDEEEPEEVSVMGVPPKADPAKHFDKNKLGGMVQMFDTMLSAEQRATLEKTLPAMAWQHWRGALNAKNEVLTKSYVIQFAAAVKQANLGDKLTEMMTSDQRELYDDITKLVSKSPLKKSIIDTQASTPPKREPPPPPPAPPAPPRAAGGGHAIPPLDPKASNKEIRKYAKKHFSLDFPPKTPKEAMLDGIKQAKVG